MFGPPTLKLRPPLDALDQLIAPLTEGELAVARALATLDAGWTVYIKPRIGLDRLDFLALHDLHGICVIEVVDWQLGTTRRNVDGDVELLGDDGTWSATTDEPRFRASRTRSSIFDQFYAQPEHGGSPTAAIRAVVIIPRFTTAGARALFPQRPSDDAESLVYIFGSDTVDISVRDIVVGLGCPVPPAASVSKLRLHIVSSETSGQRIEPTWSSAGVRDLALNPSGLTMRMVRGAAGSGKSFGLTARAAYLAAEGKRVLVLSLNVTLANRLRAMANDRCREIGVNPTLIECANFHSFCTRTVQDAEMAGHQLVAPRGAPWTVGIVAKTEQALEEGFEATYDAVLIDEGQDFTIDWWNLLRERVLVPGGEILVVADPTQDIYDRYAWTSDESLGGAGFGGEWLCSGSLERINELEESHRLPHDLLELTNEFASEHLDGEQLSGRASATTGFDGAVRRWIDVERVNGLGRAVGHEVVRLLRESPTLEPGDVAFVCDYHHDGVAAVRVIEAAGIPVHHIFSRDPDAPRRRRKHRFWPDADAVKGCTAHSLKGWEVPALVTGIGVDDRAQRLAYVAMTRVAIRPEGGPSFISVVNADARLRAFGEKFVAGSAITPTVRELTPTPTPPPPPPLTPTPSPASFPTPTGRASHPERHALPAPPPASPAPASAPKTVAVAPALAHDPVIIVAQQPFAPPMTSTLSSELPPPPGLLRLGSVH